MAVPLAEFQGPVKALFTDLDGTMATGRRLEAETIADLYKLFAAGLPVVLVTGRPAGWGHSLGSLFPFAAIVTENGGVTFVPEGEVFGKHYGVPKAERLHWRERMRAATDAVIKQIPAAQLSADSAYREVDLAIDWNEEAKLPVDDADRIVDILGAAGLAASRSSVHINFGPPGFNKFTACQRVLEIVFGEEGAGLRSPSEAYVFIGDSVNDAPMFAGFASSVGVANVRERWDELPSEPQFITDAPEGAGFRELVAHLLAL